MLRAEAGIGTQQVHEAAQHQARADQQQTSETHFADHQRAAQPEMPAVANGSAPPGAQAILHVCARGLQSRRQTEQNAGAQRDEQRKPENRGVDVNRVGARKTGR